MSKKQLAIVLDGVVQSAPVLREPITGGRGQIDMGSSGDRKKNMEEAKIIAMTLRSGALPAELEILEERSVGPTLGKDSIEKGQFAGLVGGLMVFLFMLFLLSGLWTAGQLRTGLQSSYDTGCFDLTSSHSHPSGGGRHHIDHRYGRRCQCDYLRENQRGT